MSYVERGVEFQTANTTYIRLRAYMQQTMHDQEAQEVLNDYYALTSTRGTYMSLERKYTNRAHALLREISGIEARMEEHSLFSTEYALQRGKVKTILDEFTVELIGEGDTNTDQTIANSFLFIDQELGGQENPNIQ